MTKIYFDEIKQKQTVKVLCKICRKKITRVLESYQTVNPYNRKKDGTPKSRQEVVDSVWKELQEKVKDAMMNGLYCREHQSNVYSKP